MKIEICMINGDRFLITNKELEAVRQLIAFGEDNAIIEDDAGRLIMARNILYFQAKE